jgi:hypothetical protein
LKFPANTKPLLWGAIGGAVACMIVSFSWGGWVTGGTARKDAAVAAHDAVVVALAPISIAMSNINVPSSEDKYLS